MSKQERASLPHVIAQIESARDILARMDAAWPAALEQESGGKVFPESSAIEELLHVATHETASALAFAIADIQTLAARVRIRQKYAMFDVATFERIISSGWSTPLVAELHATLPQFALPELSGIIKNVCDEWARLPKVTCSTPARSPAADQT